jgi:tetratricopeptide (TPR) repeat protein
MTTIADLIEKINTFMELNRYDEAEQLLMVVIKRDPKNPEAYYLLGEVYCKQSRFQESIRELHKADTLLPNHWRIFHLLGWAYFMNKDIQTGRMYLTKALAVEPNDIPLLCDFAVLEMNDHDYIKAKEYALTALNISPTDEMVLEVHAVVARMDELSKLVPQKN